MMFCSKAGVKHYSLIYIACAWKDGICIPSKLFTLVVDLKQQARAASVYTGSRHDA